MKMAKLSIGLVLVLLCTVATAQTKPEQPKADKPAPQSWWVCDFDKVIGFYNCTKEVGGPR